MAMKLIHCDLSIVDSSGKDKFIRPIVDGEDISLNSSRYGASSTAQELVDNLSRIAFDKNFKGLNDNATEGDTKEIYSISKITDILNVASDEIGQIKTDYSGWFKKNIPSKKPSVS